MTLICMEERAAVVAGRYGSLGHGQSHSTDSNRKVCAGSARQDGCNHGVISVGQRMRACVCVRMSVFVCLVGGADGGAMM